MKTIKLWLVTIAMLLCSLAASAHDFSVGGIYYNISSSTNLTVAVTYRGGSYSQYSNEYTGAVTIPATVTYNSMTYSVTSIGGLAFYNCSSLISITLPEGVTSIGNSAFYNCSSLTSITLPEGVTSIEGSAFEECSSLTSITIPESVTSIGNYAFYNCSSLTSITLPESVTSIGYYAFYNCSSLTAIIVDENNLVYDSRENCNAIIETSSNTLIQGCSATLIPEGVTSIGSSAFYNCSSLTSITIPEGVISIGDYAFDNCTSLKEVTFEDGSTTLSLGYQLSSVREVEGLFYDCPLETVYLGRNLSCEDNSSPSFSPFRASLKNLIITGNVTSIPSYLFYYCTNLTSIIIPKSVSWIGEGAFYGCSLTSIVVEAGNTTYYSRDNCNAIIETNSNTLIKGCESTVIPKGVTSILASAFRGCSGLTSITIPESVISIGDYAFDNCTSLKEVTFEDGSSTLSLGYNDYYSSSTGQGLFNDCPLETVYLGRNLSYSSGSSYGYSPFYNKGKLTTLTIGDNVTSIESSAFSGCSSLTSITLPEGVTSIENYAFDNCTALKKVIIEDGSTTLSLGYNGSSQGLFYDCPLVEVYLGRNLSYSSGSSYGYSPFYNKDALTNVTIGNEVTQISEYAFYGCDNIHSLTIPSGVLSIGNSAFSTPEKVIWLTNTPPTGYANAKGSINYAANDQHSSLSNLRVYPYLSSMFEVDGVKYVPVSPSERTCHAIDCAYDTTAESINVSETTSFKGVAMKVTEVMPYTFYGNNHIKEVSVSHLGHIGDYAFYNCDSIKIVNVSNQGNIGSQVFYNSDAIESVTISNHGDIGEKAFYDCDGILTATISNQGNIESQAFYDCDGIKSLDISNVGYVGDEAFRGCGALETAIVANSPKEADSTTPTPQPITFADWVSTNHSDGSTSSETYTFTAAEGAALSFNWSVSSEASYDKLIVTLDGTTILEKSGSTSGTYNNAIAQGEHTLVVKYTKDGSQSSGSDQASVSNIVVSAGSGGTTGFDGAVCNSVFYDCISLKSVTLGDKVTSLGNDAFRGCRSLQEIVIPNSVKSVGTYCFYGCTVMKNAAIGDGLTNIKEYTFANCGLEEILIGDNIISIGNYAFKGCRGMKSAVLGNGLTKVNGTMFNGCIGLENVEIGNKVTELEANAFSGCSSLPTITIPQAVTKVGDYVFAGCSKLADVIIDDRTEPLALGSNGSSPLFVDCPLDSVYIGGKITYSTTSSYGYSPFYRNTSLRTVVITDREEQIYENEFYGCTNLKNVTIGNGVKSIGNYAFSGCSSLDKFAFGSSMQRIGEEAFSDCTNLTEICSSAMNPPTCGTQALDDINKWNCILKVPTGYMAAYQAADQWKEFFFIEDIVEVATYTLTFMVDGEVYHTMELPCEAAVTMPVTPTKEGHTFSGWDKTLSTMPAEDVTINGTFTVNEYLVTFKVDGEIVYSESLEYGASIVAPDAPEKEGHTFNGWGEVGTTVPAHDVTYEANYSVNSYQLTYVVDGETVQTESVAYGTAITLIDEPVKEGHTFSGWSEVPETMPAHDVTLNGTFNVNKYLVTFKVDGEIVYSESLEYGASIVAPDAPEKEGHTFNGWGEVDTTVPAHDVTYEANYSVNSYQLTYVVDGETVQTESIAYGTAITLIDEPVKEGYTFSGWSEVPETMPAHDVTLNGTFTVNKYLVTFTVDGAVIASDSLEYGTAISVPTMPEREGYTFSGWSEVAETVPAHDVTYDASYTANIYKVYYFVGATLVHTAEVAYGEAIPEYVYEPTAEGDVFMGWIGETYETMPAHDVTYTANIDDAIEQLTIDKSQLTIYDLKGRKVTDTENLKGGIYIVNGKKVVIE